MANNDYTAVPLDDGPGGYGLKEGAKRTSRMQVVKKVVFISVFTIVTFSLGFWAGNGHRRGTGEACTSMMVEEGKSSAAADSAASTGNGLLDPQSFIPDIPMKGVQFDFPTKYEDTSVKGDLLWNDLMPIGSGFIRVPYPRRYDMPASKAIENDPEEAELYSLSGLHQLHCLGVIRDVIKKYEKKDKSRFAGAGHEYHCIDYIRQSIMCAGDTTLDFAELQPDGRRLGFSGANSTHQCRDWDAIVKFAIENRSGDKSGIA